MSHRNIRSTLVGIGMALIATAAFAQVPKKPTPKKDTTAAQHVKIRKEVPTKGVAGGEVVLQAQPCEATVPTFDPKRDEAIRMEQYKLDSIAAALEKDRMAARLQAQFAAEREKARLDSIMAAEAAAVKLRKSLERGAYVAIAGGANAAQRTTRDGYTGGWNVTVPIGYDFTDNPFGVRMDVAVDHLNGTRIHDTFENTLAASGDITVWSLNGDAKLRFHPPGLSTRSHLYLIGGVGAHRVSGGVYGTTSSQAGQNLSFNDAGTKFGWNAGAGVTIQWSGVELFAESRFFQVKTDLGFHNTGGVGTYTSFTPLVFGLNWF